MRGILLTIVLGILVILSLTVCAPLMIAAMGLLGWSGRRSDFRKDHGDGGLTR